METFKFTHKAMATQWSFRLRGDNRQYAAQAAQAAFALIDQLEVELSHYRSDSEVSQIAQLKAGEELVLTQDAFDCITMAQSISAETRGAFDITVGHLFACWMSPEGKPRKPDITQLAIAQSLTGWELLSLDPATMRVTARRSGLKIDVGGIAKGYALDRARLQLEDWDLKDGLLEAGGSTILAFGDFAWTVGCNGRKIRLKNRAISASGMSVKGDHIINPHTGRPVKDRVRSWAFSRKAATSDAFATAFLILPEKEIKRIVATQADRGAFLLLPNDEFRQITG